MNHEELLNHEQEIVSKAVKKSLSGLKPDPDLAQKVIRFYQKKRYEKKIERDDMLLNQLRKFEHGH